MDLLIGTAIVALALTNLYTMHRLAAGRAHDCGSPILLGLCAACGPGVGAQNIQRAPDGVCLCAFHAKPRR